MRASLLTQMVKNLPERGRPGLGRSPGGGHGNPLQYSCLENPHEQRWPTGYSPWGRKESHTTDYADFTIMCNRYGFYTTNNCR